jgi:hypothetical protein
MNSKDLHSFVVMWGRKDIREEHELVTQVSSACADQFRNPHSRGARLPHGPIKNATLQG